MKIEGYCWCCGKTTAVYKNKNTEKVSRHCFECVEKYSIDQRKLMETKLVFGMIQDSNLEE